MAHKDYFNPKFRPQDYPVKRIQDMSQELLWVSDAKRITLSIDFLDKHDITVLGIPAGMQAVYSVYEIGHGIRDLSAYPKLAFKWVSDNTIELAEPYTGVVQILRRTAIRANAYKDNPLELCQRSLKITQEIIGSITQLGVPPVVHNPPVVPGGPDEEAPVGVQLDNLIPILGVRFGYQNRYRRIRVPREGNSDISIDMPRLPFLASGSLHPEDEVAVASFSLSQVLRSDAFLKATGLRSNGQWVYRQNYGEHGFDGWEFIDFDTLERAFLPYPYIVGTQITYYNSSPHAHYSCASVGVYSKEFTEGTVIHRAYTDGIAQNPNGIIVYSFKDFESFTQLIRKYEGRLTAPTVFEYVHTDTWDNSKTYLLYYMDGREFGYVFSDTPFKRLHYAMVKQKRYVKDTYNMRHIGTVRYNTIHLYKEQFVLNNDVNHVTNEPTNFTEPYYGLFRYSDMDNVFKLNKTVFSCPALRYGSLTGVWNMHVYKFGLKATVVQHPVIHVNELTVLPFKLAGDDYTIQFNIEAQYVPESVNVTTQINTSIAGVGYSNQRVVFDTTQVALDAPDVWEFNKVQYTRELGAKEDIRTVKKARIEPHNDLSMETYKLMPTFQLDRLEDWGTPIWRYIETVYLYNGSEVRGAPYTQAMTVPDPVLDTSIINVDADPVWHKKAALVEDCLALYKDSHGDFQ